MARKQDAALTVAITGVSGYVAGRLVELLQADDRVDRILGFDVRPPVVGASKLVFDELDVRSPALAARLGGVDVVIHLAFVMDPIQDETEMRDINVNGSQNVFFSAGKADVRKIIYASSATVYGAHPDNDVPLTEDSPLRANLDFNYPAHKLEVEYIVREFRDEHPKIPVTVFRPAIVFGAHVDNAWSHFLEMPFIFGVKGYSPVWQFVHEEDVAAALKFAALDKELDGEYNLAPEDWVTTDEVLRLLGRQRLQLSEPRAFAVADRLWTLGVSEAPAGMIHYVMHPWVVSVDRLAEAGFVCSHTSIEAVTETIERARAYLRFGRKRIKRSSFTRGAAASLGLVGAAAAVRAARRRSA
jgi:nucleoside-diphosphate-sugar epimerase